MAWEDGIRLRQSLTTLTYHVVRHVGLALVACRSDESSDDPIIGNGGGRAV